MCCHAESYNWCTVPDSSYDVLLFPAIGVTLACLFQGRFSTTAVLIIGMRPLPDVCYLHIDCACSSPDMLTLTAECSTCEQAGFALQDIKYMYALVQVEFFRELCSRPMPISAGWATPLPGGWG